MTPFRIAPAGLVLLAALVATAAPAEASGWTGWSDFYRSFAIDPQTRPEPRAAPGASRTARTSPWIRNGQPHASPPTADPLADIPRSPRGRIPPHTPDIALRRGASPSGPSQHGMELDGVPGGWIWSTEGGVVRPRVRPGAKAARRK